MKKERLSHELLYTIYILARKGMSPIQIIKETGYKSAYGVIRNFDRVEKGLVNRGYYNERYFDILEGNYPVKEAEALESVTQSNMEELDPDPTDPFKKIEQGYQQMLQGMDEVISFQVNKQVSDVKKQNEYMSTRIAKMNEIIDDLTAENINLKDLAKGSNWMNTLKSKWS